MIRKIASLLLLLLIFSPVRGFAQEYIDGSPIDNDWGFAHPDGVVLVLSGGGTKGFAHVGVIEILERENIPIAAIVGTSMGGIVGGLYAAGYTTSEMRQILDSCDIMEIISGRAGSGPLYTPGYNRPSVNSAAPLSFFADKDWKFVGHKGLLRGKELYTFLSELTSRITVTDFNKLPTPFAAVATDLENGDTVILRDGNLATALRATMSIPMLFEPWEIEGRLLVDGGLKANLPVIVAKEIFPGHPVLAVNLSPEDISLSREQLKGIFEVAAQTLEILMIEQIRYNAAAADLVITPSVSDFGILDSGGYGRIIDCGAAAADEKISELRALRDAHGWTSASRPGDIWLPPMPIVTEISFNGLPASMEEELQEKFSDLVGRPLDMKKVAQAVKSLSEREEFLKVDGRPHHITENSVAVVFSVERPNKYEISFNGFASNVARDRWLSARLTARDLIADGDVASLEYRFSNNWGALLQYFSPLDERDRQFGITLSARREEHTPLDFDKFSFERYSAKAVYYKDFGHGTRVGGGYAVGRMTYDGGDTISGPYLDFTYMNLDDPVMPSQGFAFSSQLWYPLDETLLSRTMFLTYLPLWGHRKATLMGGLKTGEGDNPAYAAMLGGQMELDSLARNPMMGDQAWWLHLGTSTTLMKTWWGGLRVEAFGRYGQVLRDWSKKDSWWELGLSFNVLTNSVPGRIFVVYDRGNEITFGYSIGVPMFWNDSLP